MIAMTRNFPNFPSQPYMTPLGQRLPMSTIQTSLIHPTIVDQLRMAGHSITHNDPTVEIMAKLDMNKGYYQETCRIYVTNVVLTN